MGGVVVKGSSEMPGACCGDQVFFEASFDVLLMAWGMNKPVPLKEPGRRQNRPSPPFAYL